MRTFSRRGLLRLAVALPSAGLFSRYRALAAPNVNRVKITGIRAMAIRNIAGNCLIRIDTDAGITGYGEAGSTAGQACRANDLFTKTPEPEESCTDNSRPATRVLPTALK